jgi:hypothetical protein
MISLYSYLIIGFYWMFIFLYFYLLLWFVGQFYNNLKDLFLYLNLIGYDHKFGCEKFLYVIARQYLERMLQWRQLRCLMKNTSNGIIETNVETIHRYLSFVLLELIILLWLLIICFFKGYIKILATWFCWRLIWFSQSIYLDFEYMVSLE